MSSPDNPIKQLVKRETTFCHGFNLTIIWKIYFVLTWQHTCIYQKKALHLVDETRQHSTNIPQQLQIGFCPHLATLFYRLVKYGIMWFTHPDFIKCFLSKVDNLEIHYEGWQKGSYILFTGNKPKFAIYILFNLGNLVVQASKGIFI